MIKSFKCDRIHGPHGDGIQVWFQSDNEDSEDVFQFFDPDDVAFILNLIAKGEGQSPESMLVFVRDRMGLTVH